MNKTTDRSLIRTRNRVAGSAVAYGSRPAEVVSCTLRASAAGDGHASNVYTGSTMLLLSTSAAWCGLGSRGASESERLRAAAGTVSRRRHGEHAQCVGCARTVTPGNGRPMVPGLFSCSDQPVVRRKSPRHTNGFMYDARTCQLSRGRSTNYNNRLSNPIVQEFCDGSMRFSTVLVAHDWTESTYGLKLNSLSLTSLSSILVFVV